MTSSKTAAREHRDTSGRVVLAYSGGLDTSVAIPWLAERGYEVIAVVVDVGQPGDLSAAVERARRLGAAEAHRVDAADRFVEEFVIPALQLNALYQGRYPLASALSRPLIADTLVHIARQSGAAAIAHGCTGKGNDQVRFEVALGARAPDLRVLAPVREWGMSRPDAIAYARARSLPIETTNSSPYSIDENLWGRSIECGVLEDPWEGPPDEVYDLTVAPMTAPSAPRDVVVSFDQGVPAAVDGESMSARTAIETLGKLAGAHGFGRVDMIEDRLVGIKSREVYEAPAALSWIAAHADLESLTLERSVAREKRRLEQVWSNLVYEGLWFSPLREAIDGFVASTQRSVSGEVRLRLSPGSCLPTGRRSPYSHLSPELSTYESSDAFVHSDAAGFIRLWGLPSRQWALNRPGND